MIGIAVSIALAAFAIAIAIVPVVVAITSERNLRRRDEGVVAPNPNGELVAAIELAVCADNLEDAVSSHQAGTFP